MKSLRELRDKFPIQSLFVEIFSIILGVLLALLVNEWREDQSHKSQAKIALENLKNEVKSNLGLLTIIHENNLRTLQLIKTEYKNSEGDSSNIIPGIQLQETVWNTLLSTDISNYLDYEQVLKFSKIYSLQNVYKQIGLLLTESTLNLTAYSVAAKSEIDNKLYGIKFLPYFEMLVQAERGLMKSYNEALK